VILISAAVAAASVSTALSARGLWHALSDRPGELASFMVLGAVLALVAVPLHGRGSYDYSGTAVLAAGFAFGIGAAIVTALVATFVHYVRRPAKPHRAVFTAATLSLAGAAGTVPAIGSPGQSFGVRLACAAFGAALYWVVNVGLLSVAMGLTEGRRPLAIWRERFRWMTPYYLVAGPLAVALVDADDHLGSVGLFAFAAPPLFMMLSVRQYLDRTRDAADEVAKVNAELALRNSELQMLADRIHKTHLATIAALSRSMEAKDFYTGGHTERVSTIAVALAKRLGFARPDLDSIEVGGLLHDIGKIGIPESILRKPGALTDEELAIIREHPLISERILSEIDVSPVVRQIARSSHERIDGTGYPDGLAGDDIPLPARIVFVADAFDAMTTDRPYRRRRPTILALEEIRKNAGMQFCPLVVNALEELFRDEPEVVTAGYLASVA
jgi:putative nucleotidyltransferase with HDIG domain